MKFTLDPAEVISDLLARGHAVRFLARGDSMHPIIRSNEYLHVEPIGASEVTEGEVVLTLSDRGLTAHRVIARDGETIVTRGDNAAAPDGALDASRILGRVTYVERDGAERRIDRLTPTQVASRRFRIRLKDWRGR